MSDPLEVQQPENNLKDDLEAFSATLKTLRSKNGCAWNRSQTFFSLRRFLMEEAHEVLDVLPLEDGPTPPANLLCEELGDLLLQIVFISTIAEEKGLFSLHEVVSGINQKMIRRHPHVFDAQFRAQIETLSPDEVAQLWEKIKRQEKASQPKMENTSVLAGVPRSLPALERAYALGQKAKDNGFDWPDLADVFTKLQEELAEFAQATAKVPKETRKETAMESVKDEMGDVLFTLAQIARFQRYSAEAALQAACDKFSKRFSMMESFSEFSQAWTSLSDAEKETLWQKAKRHTKEG